MDLGLSGKKAIIVGGARGIGYSVAEILAREGCNIALCARSEDSVKDAVAELGKYGTKIIGKPVNAKNADDYKAWFEWAIEELDGVDILIPISSAGGGLGSEKYWHNAFEVDVLGPVRAVDAVIETMTEQQSGSIVLISTTSALEAMGGPMAYNAMKGSLLTWGKQLALHHGKDGIRVNVVCPGPIEFEGGNWDMIKGTMEKFYNSQLRQQPMGRLGKPEEVARAIVFLASDAASWCNGSNLVVDGGYTNRTNF
ncbi:oxidoreductase [Novosphingobium marinum]|uniref:NAD(P)-dependent dehydrogenase (Short-subunit alcohol dehydrogenase family) n=1 Tax=Novosphingobium marinum TaxID=1514948 RepID=A0A7Z0BUS9_9SPHN|nr:SDR family oxidoreductase [Novosphingobium marinum]NYH94492.1 NAD(P)-dependent dehydrogenase (short-subunit alcohol dehydrogenase family) [Novosphingobium marinum]GGC22741.1 oxidoreductase [Novosphingobium marinum]